MKKSILLLCIVCMASCSKTEDLFDRERIDEEAKENFPVENVDPDHSWETVGVATMTVSVNEGTGEEYVVKFYTADPFNEESYAMLLKKITLNDGKNATVTFDVPSALQYIYVVREDKKYNRQMKPVRLSEEAKGAVYFGKQNRAKSLMSRSVADVIYPMALNSAAIVEAFKTPSREELEQMESFGDGYKWGTTTAKTFKVDKQPKSIELGGLDNITLYITANIDLNSLALGTNTKIHILTGGSLALDALNMQENAMISVHQGAEFAIKQSLNLSNANLYNRGEIKTSTGSCSVTQSAKAHIYNEGEFFDDDDKRASLSINNDCFFVNAKDVDLIDLTLAGGGTFINENNGEVDIKNVTTVGGNWVNAGEFETDKLSYTDSNKYLFRNDCKLLVNEMFTMKPATGATFIMNGSSTMLCKQMDLNQATIQLGSGAFVKVENNIHYVDGNKIVGAGNDLALLYVINNITFNQNPGNPIVYSGNLRVVAKHNGNYETTEGASVIPLEQVKFPAENDGCGTNFDTEGGGRPSGDTVAMYTYVFEDMTREVGDFDYNDVVLYVSAPEDNGDVTVRLIAAGASKKLWIGYNGKDLFGEVHKAFGCDEGVLINTGGVTAPEPAPVVVNIGAGKLLSQAGDVYIYDDANYEIHVATFKKPGPGYPPYGLCIPGQWPNPKERVNIVGMYHFFEKWVQDRNTYTRWYEEYMNIPAWKDNGNQYPYGDI
jgi:hypothetical protein